jgi:tRNA(fMet)-specific endonuclease VapC
MLYLLDTNTASFVIKGNVPTVRKRLVRLPMEQVAVSVITEAELRFGLARRPEAVRLKIVVQEFLLRIEALPWDSAAARAYADLRAELEESGKPLGNLDMMIAAHALATNAVLVSNDKAFRLVRHLQLEDWTKS